MAGKFKIILAIVWLFTFPAWAESGSEAIAFTKWEEFARDAEADLARDRQNGISYVISGALALGGGLLGSSMSSDDLEKGVYTIFQSLGVASVGYGAYLWQVGGETRTIYSTLRASRLTPAQKSEFLQAYKFRIEESRRRQRLIGAITNGMIAAVNFYNASLQKDDTIRTGLYFIGGVSLLASVTMTFEF